MERQQADLGPVQETLLLPLYARALETRRKRPLLRDPKAVEMADAIDYDFSRLADRPTMLGCVMRSEIFDGWVREFLASNPRGTVVEIGAGLNTRYERLDNGTAHWLELDLPDSMALRRRFIAPTARRHLVEGSAAEPEWLESVRAFPGPQLFVSEAVLMYLSERDVRRAVELLGRNFPGAQLLMDTASATATRHMTTMPTLKSRNVTFDWSCDDPASLEKWGLKLLNSTSMMDVPVATQARMSPPLKLLTAALKRTPAARVFRVNRYELTGEPELPVTGAEG